MYFSHICHFRPMTQLNPLKTKIFDPFPTQPNPTRGSTQPMDNSVTPSQICPIMTVCWSTYHVCYSYWKHVQINVFLCQYMLHGLQNLWDQQTYRDYYNKQIVHPCPLTKIMRLERTAWRRVTCSASNVSFFYSFILNQTAWPIEIHHASYTLLWNSGRPNDYNELIEYQWITIWMNEWCFINVW